MTTRVLVIAFLAFAASLPIPSGAASAHIHTHQRKIDSNERLEDGAFSPRDVDHYAQGEHHQEFDHEAILGKKMRTMTLLLFAGSF